MFFLLRLFLVLYLFSAASASGFAASAGTG